MVGDERTARAGTRAGGFVRNVGPLYRRMGIAGLAELVIARALPRACAYERVTLVSVRARGEPHPELAPRRMRSREPDLDELFARLAALAEPEAPSFVAAELDDRFAAGDELWAFHVDGEIAHLRWTMRGQLRFRGVALPLADDERGSGAAVTLAAARRRGVYTRAGRHQRAALAHEGVVAVLLTIAGFNRHFREAVVHSDGAQPLATVHLLSLAGRRWVRATPTSPAHAALLAARGWSPGRWRRAEDLSASGRPATAGAAEWDRAAHAIRPGYLDAEMAAVKRRAHLDLLARWVPDLDRRTMLKTDLWEEAIAGDELLFTLAVRARAARGVDVAPAIVAAAARAAARRGVALHLAQGDVRCLPLGDGAVDAVLSTSTLDHLVERDRLAAMRELRRVLSPGGVLVVTCDNVDNVSDGLLSAAAAARLVPFPLEPAVSLDELRGLVEQAGLRYDDHAYLVHGPRVLTTLAVRVLRALLPRSLSGRAVARLLRALDTIGARHPRRMAAFVAVRATNPAAASDPSHRD